MACRVLHPVNHTVSIPHSIAASAARRPLGAFRLGLRQASVWPASRVRQTYVSRVRGWRLDGDGPTRCFTQVRGLRLENGGAKMKSVHELPTSGRNSTPGEPKTKLRDLIKDRLARSAVTHEDIYTLPNILTFSRLLATPAICYFVLHGQHYPAVLLFGYAGITDLLDGWIARRWNQQSVVGSVVDPMADKALMVGLTTTLAYMGHLPLWLAAIILGRDISLAIAAIYYRYASLPPPKTMARYWDFSLPSAEVHPTQVSKINTLLQLLLIGATTALPLVPTDLALEQLPSTVLDMLGDGDSVRIHDLVGWLQWLVAGTTLWSGASYTWTRSAVKILRDDLDHKSKKKILRRGRGVIAVCFGGVVVGALAVDKPWDGTP